MVVYVKTCVGGGVDLRPWEEVAFGTRHSARVDSRFICIRVGWRELSRPCCAVS